MGELSVVVYVHMLQNVTVLMLRICVREIRKKSLLLNQHNGDDAPQNV